MGGWEFDKTNKIYIDGQKIEGVDFKGFSPSVAYVDEVSNSYKKKSISWNNATGEQIKNDLYKASELLTKLNQVAYQAKVSIDVMNISDDTYKLLFGQEKPNKVKHVPGEDCLF